MHTVDLAPTSGGSSPARARFTGARGAYARMMIRGALLQVVTLGIYRFWLATEMRRFLWANTEIDGDSLDYTGTAMELLIGFLFALAILVPVYVLFGIAALELGLYSQLAAAAGFLALTAFGQYAYFRARRYRLTRTVWRGIRFHQDGSAWAYAGRSILWSIPVLATLGLAYPFAQANLERYKLAHTLYGDLRGGFAGRGGDLFMRGLALWLALIGPLAATVIYAAITVDWPMIGADVVRRGPDEIGEILNESPPLAEAVIALAIVLSYVLVAAIVLYPVFQAIVLKWWLSGLRFGEITVSTGLRKRQVYGAYLRFVLLMIAAAIVLGVVGTIATVVFGATVLAGLSDPTVQIGAMLAPILSYVVLMLVGWVLYQVVVRLAVWRMAVDSVSLTGLAAIARVSPQPGTGSALGEGLADALGAGGL